jgi:RNA polymerase sigma factor (sigma-70 family)
MTQASANALSQQEQFDQLCADHYDNLLRYALRLTGNQTEAEELTQTAFLRFLRLMKRKQWKVEVTYVQAYLNKIVNNLRNDMWKRLGKEKAVSYDDDKIREKLEREAAESDDSVSSMENRIYFKELRRALPLSVILGRLSDYEKQLFLLKKMDGQSTKEIAALVGKEVCQVRYDLQKLDAKIRYRVRKLIKETGDGNLL